MAEINVVNAFLYDIWHVYIVIYFIVTYNIMCPLNTKTVTQK